MKYSKTIAGITIEICEKAIGEDLVLTLSGGEKPHIGCVVQAVPRPSLSGDGMYRRGTHGSYNGRTDRRIIKEYRSYDDRIRS